MINVYLVAFADVGVGHSDQRARWQSCTSCACNGSKYSKTLASLTVLVSNGTCSAVFCSRCSYVMKRKPRLHDGIVTIDLGKNRLVEIPRSGSEAPDDGFTRIQLISKYPKCSHHQQKECNVRLHVNCACAIGTRDLWLHQNGFVLAKFTEL